MRTERIKSICDAAVEKQLTPGCSVGVADGGQVEFWSSGRLTYDPKAPAVTEQTVYDMASVSKVIPTASIILRLAEDRRLSLDDKAIYYLPELQNQYHEDILLRQLLSYTVVFEVGAPLAELAKEQRERVLDTIMKAPLRFAPGQEFMYTNGPFLLLGLIAERVCHKPLEEIAQEMFFRPLKMSRTSFRPELLGQEQIAPTEVDWRGDVWTGPHDETAWMMHQAGKSSGHAGLFSTAHDLLRFGEMLLNDGVWGGHHFFDPKTVTLMHTESSRGLDAHVAMGWRLNWPDIMGQSGSDQIFGKSGFTGCLLLVDPVKQRALSVTANRTYPQRPADGDRKKIFGFWRELADVVFAD